jgi:hypothetical protein
MKVQACKSTKERFRMTRWIFLTGVAVLLSNIVSLGCEEWLVGSPCVAETDTGEFVNLETPGATTYALETRSVQCQGANMVCLTTLHRYEAPRGNENGNAQNEYELWEGTHVKYSFCSCRCRDDQGHKYDRNSDKYDDLCPCPTRTTCVEVLGSDIEAPEKVRGSYCMPNCVADPTQCTVDETCTPSSNSEEPWKWSCKAIETADAGQ